MTFFSRCDILFNDSLKYYRYCMTISKYSKTMVVFITKGMLMSVSYNGLWKLMIDKKLNKKDLMKKLGISSATIAKMSKGENVSMEVLQKICGLLECNIGDVVSFQK